MRAADIVDSLDSAMADSSGTISGALTGAILKVGEELPGVGGLFKLMNTFYTHAHDAERNTKEGAAFIQYLKVRPLPLTYYVGIVLSDMLQQAPIYLPDMYVHPPFNRRCH